MTAHEWNRALDVAMEALSNKLTLMHGAPEWMQRDEAERRGALPEYLRYREVLEGLSRAIDLETPSKWQCTQLMLPLEV